MRTTIARALSCLSCVALLAAGEARADDKKDAPPSAAKADEASQHFKSGVSFYKDRDFTAAMVEFKKAFELLPNYNVLYNIGQTARELKDYAAALNAFDQYLRDGGAKVTAARKKEVQSAIDELKKKVGTLKVTVNVEGAEITVDDAVVGKSPLPEAVVANVGRHKLGATSSGYTPAQRVVDVAGTEETAVSLELVKVGADTPPPVEKPVEQKPGFPLAAWAALGATGATAIVTGVMGGLALSARSSLKTALGTFPGDGKAIADAQARTKTFAVATDVMGGITIAGAAATTVLFVLAPKLAEKQQKVGVDVGPAGVLVRGVF